jgi:hypothetical protein
VFDAARGVSSHRNIMGVSFCDVSTSFFDHSLSSLNFFLVYLVLIRSFQHTKQCYEHLR